MAIEEELKLAVRFTATFPALAVLCFWHMMPWNGRGFLPWWQLIPRSYLVSTVLKLVLNKGMTHGGGTRQTRKPGFTRHACRVAPLSKYLQLVYEYFPLVFAQVATVETNYSGVVSS
jgi:hypothetical protein